MPIYESSKDYGTGQVLILWDGDKPSNEEFMDHAQELYGVTGRLEVEAPTKFRGMMNHGTATVTPNAALSGWPGKDETEKRNDQSRETNQAP